jgi:ribonuclease P protein component
VADRPSRATSSAGLTRGASPANGLPRGARLRKRPEFLEVQARGRRVHTPHFILLVHPGERQALGVTVTRKIAGAVGRNRVKRLWREVFRLNRELFPPRCALVAVARAGAADLDYAAVAAEVASASAALFRAAGAETAPAPPTSFPRADAHADTLEPKHGSHASGKGVSPSSKKRR